jgi:DNA-binding transcriptional MerR regulator
MTKANLKRLEEGKLYYSISEVCSLTDLEQHVLRYWESEFPQLRPKKNRSGNRAYRTKEIKIVRYIKFLLYEEMYTIPGAKKKMADMNMADLDGQLTLLRVPAEPAVAKAPGAETEADTASPFGGEAAHGREGGEAAARLRAELRRVKQELQELLGTLAARGKGTP